MVEYAKEISDRRCWCSPPYHGYGDRKKRDIQRRHR